MADTQRVTTTDGISLAVQIYPAAVPDAPTVVMIHGYPDNSAVWTPLITAFDGRYRVVTYDVRGTGGSDAPKPVSRYRLPQLVDDLVSVLDATSPSTPVHLIAHDWGSIQGWHAVSDARTKGRIASYTSISGPHLDYTGAWIRRKLRPNLRHLREVFRQLGHSYYIGMFLIPLLPELGWRTGMIDRLLGKQRPTGSLSDKVNGLKLYRANMLARPEGKPAHTEIPVLVLTPTRDAYVGAELAGQAPRPYCSDLRVRSITGGHWVVATRPDIIARNAGQLIDHVEGAPAARELLAASAPENTGRHGARRSDAFAGRLAVVTGAGAGIGAATALEFARRGADVVVCDINLGDAEKTAQRIRSLGVAASAYHLDVSDADGFESFAKQVQAEHGTADIMVNNAGIGMSGPFLGTTLADWSRIIDINLWGVIHGSRLFAEQMVQRGEGGRIVNIASAAGFTPSRTYPAYATTKSAVLMLTECLRAELARYDIGAVAICPGFINSNIARATEHVGVDAAEQERLRRHAVKSYKRRNYSPEKAAIHIVDAAWANTPVKTITAESKVFLAMTRFTPALARRIATVDLNSL